MSEHRRVITDRREGPLPQVRVPYLIEPTAQTTCETGLRQLGYNSLASQLSVANGQVLNLFSPHGTSPSEITFQYLGQPCASIAQLSAGLMRTTNANSIELIQGPYGVSYYVVQGGHILKPPKEFQPDREPNRLKRFIHTFTEPVQEPHFPELVDEFFCADYHEGHFKYDSNAVHTTYVVPFPEYTESRQWVHFFRRLNTLSALLHYHSLHLPRQLTDKTTGALLAYLQKMINHIPDHPTQPVNKLAMTDVYQGLTQLLILRTDHPHKIEEAFYDSLQQPRLQKTLDTTHQTTPPSLPYNESTQYRRELARQLVLEGLAPDTNTALIQIESAKR